jgi:hypothetical protein
MATYVSKDNQRIGPLDDAQILTALRDHTYSPDDLAWREGMAEWEPLRNLFPSGPGSIPPPLPAAKSEHLGDNAGIRLLLPVGRSGWAIAAGYLGLFSLIILPAPIALVISIVAILDIRKSRASEHPKHGMGRAIFGLIMGILGTVIMSFVLLGMLMRR